LKVIAPEPGAGAEKPQSAVAMEELPSPVSIQVGANDRDNHNDQH
jgi:hypothetical protein